MVILAGMTFVRVLPGSWSTTVLVLQCPVLITGRWNQLHRLRRFPAGVGFSPFAVLLCFRRQRESLLRSPRRKYSRPRQWGHIYPEAGGYQCPDRGRLCGEIALLVWFAVVTAQDTRRTFSLSGVHRLDVSILPRCCRTGDGTD